MSGSHLRSNNPFAQDAEEEIQQHITGNSNGLSRQSSINNGVPDPSILETSSVESPAIDGGHSIPQQSSNTTSNNEVPTIQIDTDGNNLNVDNSIRHNSTGSNHNWQEIQDSTHDEPPPAYSEIDPVSSSTTPLSIQDPPSTTYNRPQGPPPPNAAIPYTETAAPPLPSRPSQIQTQFSPPPGPPPSHSHSQSFSPPPGPPPSHLLNPQPASPSLPPRPTSPRLPPRPSSNAAPPRRNVYPGASGATYSNIGVPPRR